MSRSTYSKHGTGTPGLGDRLGNLSTEVIALEMVSVRRLGDSGYSETSVGGRLSMMARSLLSVSGSRLLCPAVVIK